MKDPRQRSDGLGEAAAALSGTAESPQAAALFEEALTSARQIEDPVSQAHALADLAARLGRSRQGEKAREVLAEAERAADRISDRGLQQEVMEKIRLVKS